MILIAIIISIAAAFFWHLFTEKFYLACIGSVVTTVPIVWLFVATHFGTLGSIQFIQNAAGVGIFSLAITVVTGLIFRKTRKKRGSE